VWRRYLAGSAAGVTSVFLTYPLEVIRVRLAFETKVDTAGRASLGRIFKQIYHEHPPQVRSASEGAIAAAENVVQKAVPTSGIVNFYRGFVPSVLGMLQYAGTSFLVHDTVGDLFRHPSIARQTLLRPEEASLLEQGSITTDSQQDDKRYRRPQLRAVAELAAGAVAGLASQTASYPLEIIRRRMQVGGAVGDGHRLTMAETVKRVFLERGWRGFFVGLSIGYLKIAPLTATSFFVYERGKAYLGID
jgi:solute carrier family 25 (mitochondrial carrier protein), member 16